VPYAHHSIAQLIEKLITPKLATAIRYLITNTAHSYVTKLFVRYQTQQQPTAVVIITLKPF